MTQSRPLIEDKTETRTSCSDTVELPKHNSIREDFLLTLKLVGIASAILGAIWVIEYLKSG